MLKNKFSHYWDLSNGWGLIKHGEVKGILGYVRTHEHCRWLGSNYARSHTACIRP